MRFVRSALVGVIALAFGAVVSPNQAVAAVPSPPYNAFVLDGGTGSSLVKGVLAFDLTNSTITLFPTSGSNNFIATVRSTDPAHQWNLSFTAPSGSAITVGTTYPTLRSGPDATHGRMVVSGDNRACDYQSGFMTVNEYVRPPGATRPTVLAATFSISCDSDEQVLFGAVRFNSSMSVAVATPDAVDVDFGEEPGTETLTITSAGSAGSVLGAASIVDGGTTFTVTTDTCSNATLAPGETCTIGVRAIADGQPRQTAWLRLPANNPSGAVHVGLAAGIDPKRLTVSPGTLNFGRVIIGQESDIQSFTLTASGFAPVTISGFLTYDGMYQSFTYVGGSCLGTTLQVGQSCTLNMMSRPTVQGLQSASLIVHTDNLSSPMSLRMEVFGESNNVGSYYPLAPSRILDTRVGNGAPPAPVGPGGSIHLQVTGRGGVPDSGVSAVVLNVTVTEPTMSGHITVWPTGAPMPTASSLNFVAGWTGANSVTVEIGGTGPGGGKVDLYNSAGKTHLIADVVGYYTQDNTLVSTKGYGGEFHPTPPQRLFDSRVGGGEKLAGGDWIELGFSYGQEFDPHVRALAVNITAVDGSGDGYLTAFNAEGTPPLASTLNFTRMGAVPNFAIVPTSQCLDCQDWPIPKIGIYVSVDVHVIVDIVGFYDDGQLAEGVHDGLRYRPRVPLRITDSRIGRGFWGPLGQASTVTLVPPFSELPPATVAVALNVTAVSPTATTFLSVWPYGSPQPTVSTLNPNAGQIVANATPVLLDSGNRFNVYNNLGSVHLVIDMVGAFYYLPASGMSSSSLASVPQATRLRAQLHHR